MELKRNVSKRSCLKVWENIQDLEGRPFVFGKIPDINIDSEQVALWCEEFLPKFSKMGKYQKAQYAKFVVEVSERLIIDWIERWGDTVEQGKMVAPQSFTKKQLKDSIKKMVTLKGDIRIHE